MAGVLETTDSSALLLVPSTFPVLFPPSTAFFFDRLCGYIFRPLYIFFSRSLAKGRRPPDSHTRTIQGTTMKQPLPLHPFANIMKKSAGNHVVVKNMHELDACLNLSQ